MLVLRACTTPAHLHCATPPLARRWSRGRIGWTSPGGAARSASTVQG